VTPLTAAIAILLIVTLCYAGLCAAAPFGKCIRCRGERGRACPACDGSGHRTRLGRRLYHWWRREYRTGNRPGTYDDYRD
jgi:hypothetical protein